jgi:hypothetical protein
MIRFSWPIRKLMQLRPFRRYLQSLQRVARFLASLPQICPFPQNEQLRPQPQAMKL